MSRLQQRAALAQVAIALCLLHAACAAEDALRSNCRGSGARVRQLLLYQLRSTKPSDLVGVNAAFQQRMAQCRDAGLLFPGSSRGGPALTTTPAVYGFLDSSPMPPNMAIAEWVGWLDFTNVSSVVRCLALNQHSGALARMRSFAAPNGRVDLVIEKNSIPGVKASLECPLPESYAPATVRHVFAYMLRGQPSRAACARGAELLEAIAEAEALDVRHGNGCSLLSDADAARFGVNIAGFGGYTDYESMRHMTAELGSRKPEVVAARTELRSYPTFILRSSLALPWSG